MIKALKDLFGMGQKINFEELISNGALLIDVRSKGEYAGGHVKGSINIPLDQLPTNLKKIKSKEQPIITCCASGMRSESAKNILQSQGFTNVHNGGSWQHINNYVKE